MVVLYTNCLFGTWVPGCYIGGYKKGVDVAILSFHWLYLNSIGCNPNSTEAILAFHWVKNHMTYRICISLALAIFR